MALNFSFTDEHDELRATVRAFLQEQSDESAVRAQMASERGYDAGIWSRMAEELGLAGLIIPEEHGGAGFSYVELLIVMEEMGRALLCSPYLGTAVFAANALLACADEATQKDLLAGIASGAKIVSVAHAEPGGRWDLAGIEMRARPKGARYTPVSKRQDRPDAIAWLVKNYPELSDAQISKLIGTTKNTIQAVNERSHWNSPNIRPRDPVLLGLCSQSELNAAIEKARLAMEKAGKPAPKPVEFEEPAPDVTGNSFRLP